MVPPELSRLAPIVATVPGLKLFVLHGSRARATAHDLSDWDFAYLGTDVDHDEVLARVVRELAVDSVDLVDLGRASALIRHRVACDGVVVFENVPGTFDVYRLEAIHAWCDLEPVLRPIYERALAEMRA